MAEPILVIDPGHGGKDAGGGSNEQWKEKNLVLKISLYQFERFQELNVPVAITRKTDQYLSPSERTRIVRESGAEHCISNHINATSSSKARGVETIHSIYTDGSMAQAIYDAIVAEGIPGRRVFTRTGADGRDYYFMHRETGSVKTVIVEYGFATNPEDAKILENRWKELAEAVVKAYCEYAGFEYKPPEPDDEELPVIQGKAKVVINGNQQTEGYLINNSVYVPIRFISDAMGAKVRWDNATKTAYIDLSDDSDQG